MDLRSDLSSQGRAVAGFGYRWQGPDRGDWYWRYPASARRPVPGRRRAPGSLLIRPGGALRLRQRLYAHGYMLSAPADTVLAPAAGTGVVETLSGNLYIRTTALTAEDQDPPPAEGWSIDDTRYPPYLRWVGAPLASIES